MAPPCEEAMEHFPLFSLDNHLFTDTITHTAPIDIFHMAISSAEALAKVQYSRIPIKRLNFNVRRRHPRIAVVGNRGGDEEESIDWRFVGDDEETVDSWFSEPSPYETLWEETLTIGGLELPTRAVRNSKNGGVRLVSRWNEPFEALKAVTEFLGTLFKDHRRTEFVIETSDWASVDAFRALNLPMSDGRVDLFARGKSCLSSDWLRVVLDDEQVQETTAHAPLPDDFVHETAIKKRKLALRGTGFTLGNLVQMQTEYFSLTFCRLAQTDVNEFLKRWSDGEAGVGLKTASFGFHPRLDFRRDTLAAGILWLARTQVEHRKGDLHYGAYRQIAAEVTDGFDVKRRTDGTRATVTWTNNGETLWIFVK